MSSEFGNNNQTNKGLTLMKRIMMKRVFDDKSKQDEENVGQKVLVREGISAAAPRIIRVRIIQPVISVQQPINFVGRCVGNDVWVLPAVVWVNEVFASFEWDDLMVLHNTCRAFRRLVHPLLTKMALELFPSLDASYLAYHPDECIVAAKFILHKPRRYDNPLPMGVRWTKRHYNHATCSAACARIIYSLTPDELVGCVDDVTVHFIPDRFYNHKDLLAAALKKYGTLRHVLYLKKQNEADFLMKEAEKKKRQKEQVEKRQKERIEKERIEKAEKLAAEKQRASLTEEQQKSQKEAREQQRQAANRLTARVKDLTEMWNLEEWNLDDWRY